MKRPHQAISPPVLTLLKARLHWQKYQRLLAGIMRLQPALASFCAGTQKDHFYFFHTARVEQGK